MSEEHDQRPHVKIDPENLRWLKRVQKLSLIKVSISNLANTLMRFGRDKTEQQFVPKEK